MLTVDNILFPTDFSPCAEEAFEHAIHLAKQTGATVHVLTVVGDASEDRPMEYLPLEEGEDGESLQYAPDPDDDTSVPVPVVYHQVKDVSPAEAIVRRADESDVDVVVMGTHGRRGADRLLSGSVAEEVVRRAACPVFTVLCKAATDDADAMPSASPINTILVPVDLSEHTADVVAHAQGMATLYGASLHLLHVIEDVAYPSVYGVDPITPILPDVMDRAEKSLQHYAKQLRERGCKVDTQVLAGYAAYDIVDTVNGIGADLILMGTHGRTGLKRFLVGSVTEKVVRRAPCPVFVVKNFGKTIVDNAQIFQEA
ncbi:MAG: universal stress protein [Longimonas sp.]|uniref:universal stress protein n=1 Tax=Longimonas sp. TaxID=2039626 RepID=UPI00335203FD